MKTRLLHIRVNVSDLVAARHFYRTVLGFEEAGAWPEEQPTYVDYVVGEGAVFAIEQRRQLSPGGARCNFVVADVRRLWMQLRGIVEIVEPYDDGADGVPRFAVRDPDGNEIGFVQE